MVTAATITSMLAVLVALNPHLDWPHAMEKAVLYSFILINIVPVTAAMLLVALPAVALGAGESSLAVAWFVGTLVLCVPWWDWVARGWARRLSEVGRNA